MPTAASWSSLQVFLQVLHSPGRFALLMIVVKPKREDLDRVAKVLAEDAESVKVGRLGGVGIDRE